MKPPRLGHDNLGLGVGLRSVHFDYILQNQPEVDWFEIISENFIDSQGRPRYVLQQIAERYPVVMHGVSLSIGSTDPARLRVPGQAQAAGPGDRRAVDLRPPLLDGHPRPQHARPAAGAVHRGDAAPRRRAGRAAVQDFLERPFVLENPSSYITFQDSTMDEWEFVTRMAEEADCGLLLDVNNVYVSSFNHDMDPDQFIRSLPHERIVQFHLAGHTDYTHPPHRHARQPRHRSGLGALPHGPPAHRRRLDPARVGRQHPALPGGARGGAQGQAVHGRAPAEPCDEDPEETPSPLTAGSTVFHPLHHIRPEVE